MRNELRLVSLLLFWLVPRVVLGSEKQAAPERDSGELQHEAVTDDGRASEPAPMQRFLAGWKLSIPGNLASDWSKEQSLARAHRARFSTTANPPLRPLAMLVASPPPPTMQFGAGGDEYPTYEIAAGYTFLRDLDSETNFPFGWSASFAKNMRPSLGLVGEVSGNYKSESGASLNVHSFLGGVRFSRRGGSATPYVGILGGLARSSANVNVLGVGIGASSSDLSFQVGGGIDLTVQDRWALRAGVDYQAIVSDETVNLFRIQAGMVYRIGGSDSGTTPSPSPPTRERVFEGGAPPFELSGEYVFLSDFDLDVNFPFGWNFSFARNFSSSLGVAGEVGASYKSEQGADLTIWDFLGGARFSRRSDGAVSSYVEVLGGLARASASAGGLSASGTDPAIQAGGGVDLKIQQNAALRVGVDYRAIFSGETIQEVRIRAGVVFGFGGTTEEMVAVEPPPPPPPSWEQPVREPPPPQRPTAAPPPPVTEPQPPPAPQPEPRPTTPAPAPAPESAFDRGRALTRGGDYEGAAGFFMDHLRREADNRFTIAIGLFCDRRNVEAHVINSGHAPELFLLSVPRQGQSCFGVYWGLYDSREEAQRAIDSLPVTIRSSSGHVVLPASRLIR